MNWGILLVLFGVCSCSSLKVTSSVDHSETGQGSRKVLYTHRTYSPNLSDVGSSLVITLEYPLEFEAELELSNIRITATLVDNASKETSSPLVTLSRVDLDNSTFTTRYVCGECPFKLRMGEIVWDLDD